MENLSKSLVKRHQQFSFSVLCALLFLSLFFLLANIDVNLFSRSIKNPEAPSSPFFHHEAAIATARPPDDFKEFKKTWQAPNPQHDEEDEKKKRNLYKGWGDVEEVSRKKYETEGSLLFDYQTLKEARIPEAFWKETKPESPEAAWALRNNLLFPKTCKQKQDMVAWLDENPEARKTIIATGAPLEATMALHAEHTCRPEQLENYRAQVEQSNTAEYTLKKFVTYQLISAIMSNSWVKSMMPNSLEETYQDCLEELRQFQIDNPWLANFIVLMLTIFEVYAYWYGFETMIKTPAFKLIDKFYAFDGLPGSLLQYLFREPWQQTYTDRKISRNELKMWLEYMLGGPLVSAFKLLWQQSFSGLYAVIVIGFTLISPNVSSRNKAIISMISCSAQVLWSIYFKNLKDLDWVFKLLRHIPPQVFAIQTIWERMRSVFGVVHKYLWGIVLFLWNHYDNNGQLRTPLDNDKSLFQTMNNLMQQVPGLKGKPQTQPIVQFVEGESRCKIILAYACKPKKPTASLNLFQKLFRTIQENTIVIFLARFIRSEEAVGYLNLFLERGKTKKEHTNKGLKEFEAALASTYELYKLAVQVEQAKIKSSFMVIPHVPKQKKRPIIVTSIPCVSQEEDNSTAWDPEKTSPLNLGRWQPLSVFVTQDPATARSFAQKITQSVHSFHASGFFPSNNKNTQVSQIDSFCFIDGSQGDTIKRVSEVITDAQENPNKKILLIIFHPFCMADQKEKFPLIQAFCRTIDKTPNITCLITTSDTSIYALEEEEIMKKKIDWLTMELDNNNKPTGKVVTGKCNPKKLEQLEQMPDSMKEDFMTQMQKSPETRGLYQEKIEKKAHFIYTFLLGFVALLCILVILIGRRGRRE